MKQCRMDLKMDWEKYTDLLVRKGFKGECSVWRKHMQTSSNLFNASCVVHDVCYARGGKEFDRMEADRGLYRRSILNAASTDKVRLMWYYCFVATTWYLAVRLFGWMAFEYGPYKSIEEILLNNELRHKQSMKERMNAKINRVMGIKWD